MREMENPPVNNTEKIKPSQEIDDKEVILVVDDDEFIREALRCTLASEHYNVIIASTGADAIEILDKNPVALIICDQRMPGITGAEVLKHALQVHPDCIRIIMTGGSELSTAIESINVGQVSQFIVKPWDNAALLQTIHTSIEKYRLSKENKKLQSLIEKQHQELMKAHENLRHELQIGAHIQEVLLMGKIPNDVPGMTIEAISLPSGDVDGDFIDFYRPSASTFDVVIGDVMGKGVPAALVGTAVKTQLVRYALPFTRSVLFEKSSLGEEDLLSPQAILTNVNKEIGQLLVEIEFFVSLFYGRFDLYKHTFTYVDCGSTKPIHYRASQNKISLLSGPCIPLGMVETCDYRNMEVDYGEGDLFIFYSDGVTEARSTSGELYGVERIQALVKDNIGISAQDLQRKIKQSVMEFVGKKHLDDDLTVIVIKVLKCLVSNENDIQITKFTSDLAQLSALRDFVHSLCQHVPGDSNRLSSQMQLALDEAFCNIVQHGYESEPTKEIVIKGDLSKEGITFDIADQGRVFNPEMTPQPNFSGDQYNGFGWYIIRQIADQVTYTPKASSEGWNHLRVFKRYCTKEELMEISSRVQDDILIVKLEGENFDAKETPNVKQKVIDLIFHSDARNVVLDLQNLQFIDSSGLGCLLSILRVINSQSGEMKLGGINKSLRTIFELVCMHKIFSLYNTLDEAINAFKSKVKY